MPFLPIKDRLDHLEETAIVLRRLFDGETVTLEGKQVTVRDAVTVVQRLEMVRRIADEIAGYVVELGTDGRLLALQLDELMAGVETDRPDVTVVDGPLAADERRTLVAGAGCYLSLARSSELDLPALESLAAGTPVVATGAGLETEGFLRIRSAPAPIPDRRGSGPPADCGRSHRSGRGSARPRECAPRRGR